MIFSLFVFSFLASPLGTSSPLKASVVVPLRFRVVSGRFSALELGDDCRVWSSLAVCGEFGAEGGRTKEVLMELTAVGVAGVDDEDVDEVDTDADGEDDVAEIDEDGMFVKALAACLTALGLLAPK